MLEIFETLEILSFFFFPFSPPNVFFQLAKKHFQTLPGISTSIILEFNYSISHPYLQW